MATGAEIGAALAIKAAEEFAAKVGENVAHEFTDWLFGKDDDFDVINKKLDALQRQINLIETKLDRVVSITSTTLELVKNFPEVLLRSLVEAERNKAHRDLKSAITVFEAIESWDGEVDLNAVTERYQDWNTLIDLEDRVEELIRLPSYAELLRAVSLGALTPALMEGISIKIKVLSELLESLVNDKLVPLLREVETLINEGYVVNGGIMLSEPWIRWEPAEERGSMVVYDRCTHAGYHDPDRCWQDRYQPDVAWNRRVQAASERMPVIIAEISAGYIEVQSVQVVLITLTRFRDYLARSSSNGELQSFTQPKVMNGTKSKTSSLFGVVEVA